jgi:UDP-glucuronate 4-epimerase
MRVLLTGGAGFIGSHLGERLLGLGHEVTCLDDFNGFYDPAVKRRNVAPSLARPGYTLVEGDLLDAALLDRVFGTRFDAVAHLAAYAGVRPSIENPGLYERVNVGGTLALLERCRAARVPKLVFASSSSVYGGRADVPFRETDDVSRPISPYAATKLSGEALCYTYHHLFGTSVHCLRFFTVYGPRQRPEMAIHLFASSMREGRPVRMFGDGGSSRDYTYIDDIVDGVVASIERCAGFEILNLGGRRATSLAELVALIGRRLRVTPRIERLPDQPGDVPVTFADVDKAARVLGYAPKVGIEEGIGRFCDWLEALSR